jgi:rubrerythrin
MDEHKFKQIISFAIQREGEAVEMYSKMASDAHQPGVAVFLTEMADEEREHERLLKEFIETRDTAQLKFQVVPDLKISEYLKEVECSNDMSYQDILVMSMKKEEAARDMYAMLADTNLDPEVQKLFTFLSQQEAKHKLKLEKEYDDAILSED